MYRMTLPMHELPLASSQRPGHLEADTNAASNVNQLIFLKNVGTSPTETAVEKNLEKLQAQVKELKFTDHEFKKTPSTRLVIDGMTYDVGQFLDIHPGGPEILLEHASGGDVGRLMRGFDGPTSHAHSSTAFQMLEQFRVKDETLLREAMRNESVGMKKFVVDLDKPLVFQVGHLGADYDVWVHQPIICKEPPRFFKSDVAEFFTRTKWYMIPIIWMPVFLWTQIRAVKFGLPPDRILPCLALGGMLWTLAEYLIHRFIFHMKVFGYWTATFHYLLHGFHHKHPMDSMRLVFPPAFTLVFSYVLWYMMKIFFPNGMRQSVSGGGLLAYIVYDLTHYFLHYGTPFSSRLRSMKRYHLNHHFKVQKDSYGITSEFWDWVFGTLPSSVTQKFHYS